MHETTTTATKERAMTTTKTTRHCPGHYEVSDGHYTVQVCRNDLLRGAEKWIAYAEWDRFLVIDPVRTKRQAVAEARLMIQDAHEVEVEEARAY